MSSNVVTLEKAVIERVIEALEREQVVAMDDNGAYTINVTPKHIKRSIVELRAALAASQAVEPPKCAHSWIKTEYDQPWMHCEKCGGDYSTLPAQAVELLYVGMSNSMAEAKLMIACPILENVK